MAERESSAQKAAEAPREPEGLPARVTGPPGPPSAPPPPRSAPPPAPKAPSAPDLTDLAAARSVELDTQAVAEARDVVPRVRSRPPGGTPSAQALAIDARPLAAYELLARSARLADLVQLTREVTIGGARARTLDWSFASKVSGLADDARLPREEGDTRFGNALDVLATGGEGPAEHALASALFAHAVAESPRGLPEERDTLAGDVLWLATHTSFDATPLLDRALGDDASDLWTAIAARIRRIERGEAAGALGRAEAVVGCAALSASGSSRARALVADLAAEVKDPVLLRVLATGDGVTPAEVRLEGEIVPAPRGPVATTLLAVSGLLLAFHAARLVARVALAYRRPAEVALSEHGVRVKTRTELLGRTVREREHVILRSGLVRVIRDVRFPSVAFYAGLLALVIGSYIGVRAFADGVRAASPSLLVVGILVIGLGIGADFVLGTLLPGSLGRVRVAFVPRSGPVVCVGDVDRERADDALTRALARK